ncbi:hypothetical protein BGX27_004056 [Mortierella sp. AM989]|nr:hypothetical protein BGX27_004056 [Mortierella sp. AM989]
MSTNISAQVLQQGNEEIPEEEEYDRYRDNPDLLGEAMPKAARLFSFDWASGYISPFRQTPQDILGNLLRNVEFSTPGKDSLVDLGCGDGLVLLQALATFPQSQLIRAIGVDLDMSLLETTRDKIQQDKSATPEDLASRQLTSSPEGSNDYAILPRLELYHGDLMNMDETLSTIMIPLKAGNISASSLHDSVYAGQMTMRRIVQDCSHIFVYLLPEAISKLEPLLLQALEQEKIILSMQWEIPELKKYQTRGGADQRYYIYSRSP